jgi:hypothetical protein
LDYFEISGMSPGLAVQCCDWTVELSGAAAFPQGRKDQESSLLPLVQLSKFNSKS